MVIHFHNTDIISGVPVKTNETCSPTVNLMKSVAVKSSLGKHHLSTCISIGDLSNEM